MNKLTISDLQRIEREVYAASTIEQIGLLPFAEAVLREVFAAPKTEALEGVRELPELPKPAEFLGRFVDERRGLFTADQMREYALAALAATPAAPRSAESADAIRMASKEYTKLSLEAQANKRREYVEDLEVWIRGLRALFPPPPTPSEGGKQS